MDNHRFNDRMVCLNLRTGLCALSHHLLKLPVSKPPEDKLLHWVFPQYGVQEYSGRDNGQTALFLEVFGYIEIRCSTIVNNSNHHLFISAAILPMRSFFSYRFPIGIADTSFYTKS
jgi:hypothetical protein